MKSAYAANGYHLIRQAVMPAQIEALKHELACLSHETNNYGVRELMRRIPAIRVLATSAPLLDMARAILGAEAQPVRSVFFDKVPGANWNVAWHQDTSVALKARHPMEGFGPWSEKHGVVHAEPPQHYLRQMVTLRLHLDPANSENGVLRVIPGSHRHGRIKSQQLLELVAHARVSECNAEPGDLLLMSPLLFHSSRKATRPSHRRIIHIEYSAMALPAPLQWHETPRRAQNAPAVKQ